MSTYAIGDVQGCFDELMELLSLVHFDRSKDCLWFVGDLVNRGPRSLEVLRFIKDLPSSKVVLGNHDLHLIATACSLRPLKSADTLGPVLEASDCDELIDWLRYLPLFVHDDVLGYSMMHAGLASQWSLDDAILHAKEVEQELQGEHYIEVLRQMYGNEPRQWEGGLAGMDRLRCIINYFTRVRYCDVEGGMDLTMSGPLGSQPVGLIPWYQVPDRKSQDLKIIFGHWAALKGNMMTEHLFALDTGCVWGGKLRALRLEDQSLFEVDSFHQSVNKGN
jgi:bis(5'-nucleosyl)-tetraphosphatase (symmetrical)